MLIIFIALLGLSVGSFLNVVIYRLPVIMDRAERAYAQAVINGEALNEIEDEPFNLLYPASSCPKCGHRIRFWQNIPLLSYIVQRGKCVGCAQPISPRYFIVELITMLLSVIVAIHFSNPYELAVALLFTWALIALFFIDADTQLLPDSITLPLVWLGLIAGVFQLFVSLETAVIGATVGYMSLWTVYWLFKLIFHKEGMGYGDFKLVAALCAFQGVDMLPLILLIAPILGLIFALFKQIGFGRQFAFGPFLAIAGWLTFMYGGSIAAFLGLGYGY